MALRRQRADDWSATASAVETAAVLTIVGLPLVARGVIIRRPRVVRIADRLDLDRRAVKRLQRLRRRHGPGPLRLRVPMRNAAIVLDRHHARRVLEGSPEPFAPASPEKRAALDHFQPHGVLASRGEARHERRQLNERALDHPTPIHHDGPLLAPAITDEAAALARATLERGELDWEAYSTAWWRMVRRVVLGDAARDDERTTDLLARLRKDANWAFLRPKRRWTRDEFLTRLQRYVDAPQHPSLTATLAAVPTTETAARHEQIPQWLFAFDAASWASFRALALLATHPEIDERVRHGLATDVRGAGYDEFPVIRATMLESLRLWPTTPAILRSTLAPTTWDAGTLPAATSMLVYAPLLHRDDEQVPFADEFAPDIWLDGSRPDDLTLVPFSTGPGECPGRNVVLFAASTFLATMLTSVGLELKDHERIRGADGLRGTLDPFTLEFAASAGIAARQQPTPV